MLAELTVPPLRLVPNQPAPRTSTRMVVPSDNGICLKPVVPSAVNFAPHF